MENVLYDYYLVTGMVPNDYVNEGAMNLVSYRKAVLIKHGVTDEEWQRSMEYYCRHASVMYEIYERLSERMQADVVAYGGDAHLFAEGEAVGDTTNIWTKQTSLVLMQSVPYNTFSYTLKADTSWYAGDKFTFQFDTQFIYQEGNRDLVVVIAMTLANDSVITRTMHYSQDGKMSLTISDEDHKGIKSLQGYVMLTSNQNSTRTDALHLLVVRNIRLVRMHPDSKGFEERLRKDSVAMSSKDSTNNTIPVNPNENKDSMPRIGAVRRAFPVSQ